MGQSCIAAIARTKLLMPHLDPIFKLLLLIVHVRMLPLEILLINPATVAYLRSQVLLLSLI